MDEGMEGKSLDIASLKGAVKALEAAIKVYNADTLEEDIRHTTLRPGVIHNFEVAYEECRRSMKRWLEANGSRDIVKGATYKQFYKSALEKGLISNINVWYGFHDARCKGLEIYREDIAEEVFDMANRFIPVAQELVAGLEAKI